MIESNPFATLQQITAGYIVSRCLHVVANLGVADVLDETPRTAADLVALLDVHPGALGRIMALLSSHGIFEAWEARFFHSEASRLLLSDHPHSMRAFVQMFGLPVYWVVVQDIFRGRLPLRGNTRRGVLQNQASIVRSTVHRRNEDVSYAP